MLDGIVLLDAMDDLDAYQSKIDEIADHTGLPILNRENIGLGGLNNVLIEALDQNQQKPSKASKTGARGDGNG